MKKIPTLFVRDPQGRRYVTPEVHPECQWVLDGEGIATRKYDGTCVMLDDDGNWWARREVKPGKISPPRWRFVEEDKATGKCVGWEPFTQGSYAKVHNEAQFRDVADGRRFAAGTYELCGPKINGNPDHFERHLLISHTDDVERYPAMDSPRGYDELRKVMAALPWEGIVWHHPDGRMAKLKVRDFSTTRPNQRDQTDRERGAMSEQRCVHCGAEVRPDGHGDWIHARGLYRCQSSTVAYGHLAHPAGVPCRADGPNPCLGASAIPPAQAEETER